VPNEGRYVPARRIAPLPPYLTAILKPKPKVLLGPCVGGTTYGNEAVRICCLWSKGAADPFLIKTGSVAEMRIIHIRIIRRWPVGGLFCQRSNLHVLVY
jgi:hypothetical protein